MSSLKMNKLALEKVEAVGVTLPSPSRQHPVHAYFRSN
jgi:hypothetical protein